MNNEDKSLIDKLWKASGLGEELKPEPPEPQETEAAAEVPQAEVPAAEDKPAEEPVEAPAEEQAAKVPAEEQAAEAPEAEEDPPAEEPAEAPAEEQAAEEPEEEAPAEKPAPEKKPEEPATKKKDIKFLVIYTVVFVVVISALIAGSYLITSRIHKQMADHNANLNTSQSTLKNIQDENASLRAENAALKEENTALITSQEEADALVDSVGEMTEHDGYLLAAQSAYIDGERTEARTILKVIDREKLSQPARDYYDLLQEKLN